MIYFSLLFNFAIGFVFNITAHAQIPLTHDVDLLIQNVCKSRINDENSLAKLHIITIEEKIIAEYTSDCYKPINQSLRYPNETNNDAQLLAAILSTSLSKLPKQNKITYRGVDLSYSASNPFKIDKIFSDSGFFSTSLSKEVACSFAKTALLIIHSRSGVDISELSSNPEEKEVIFQPKTKFRVLSILKIPTCTKANQYQIELEEI